MELRDTIEMMNSDDYKERFRAEYYQTKIRYNKLNHFCNRIEVADVMSTDQPDHATPCFMLRDQYNAMGEYLSILEKRAIIENIEL